MTGSHIISSPFVIAGHKVQLLKQQLQASQKAAFAEGTYKNLQIQWKLYLEFCKDYQLQPVPVSVEVLCLYCQFLSNRMKASETVKNYVNGVKVLHLLLDLPVGVFKSFEYHVTIRGIARLKQHQPKQAAPITVKMLKEMSKYVDKADPCHVVVWAAILVAFFGLLRKSNLVPDTADSFNPARQLCRGDIDIAPEFMLINIKWSKTNQFRDRNVQMPIKKLPGVCFCPVSAYSKMCELVKGDAASPAFVLPSKKGRVPLTYLRFHKVFRCLIQKAGWDSSAFSSHSLRRGGASLAFRAKVPSEMIKAQGDWRSDAYLRYLSVPLGQRIGAASQVQRYIMSRL